MQPVPDNMTSDHIKSHLQKYRANSKSSRDEFMADYDRALQEATSKAQAAEAAGQAVFPPGFSTFPFSMPPPAQTAWPPSLPMTQPRSSWFVETQADEMEHHSGAEISQFPQTSGSGSNSAKPGYSHVHKSHHLPQHERGSYHELHQPVPGYGSLGRLAALQAAALGVSSGQGPHPQGVPQATAPRMHNAHAANGVSSHMGTQHHGFNGSTATSAPPHGGLHKPIPRSASAPALEPPVDQALAPLLGPLQARQRDEHDASSPLDAPVHTSGGGGGSSSQGVAARDMLAAVARMRSSMRMHREMTSASSVNISKYSGAAEHGAEQPPPAKAAPPPPQPHHAPQRPLRQVPGMPVMSVSGRAEAASMQHVVGGAAAPGSTAGSVLGITGRGGDDLSTGGGDMLPDGLSDFGSLGSLDVSEGPHTLLSSNKAQQPTSLHDVDPFAFLPHR